MASLLNFICYHFKNKKQTARSFEGKLFSDRMLCSSKSVCFMSLRVLCYHMVHGINFMTRVLSGLFFLRFPLSEYEIRDLSVRKARVTDFFVRVRCSPPISFACTVVSRITGAGRRGAGNDFEKEPT